jgi:hypothetical protein
MRIGNMTESEEEDAKAALWVKAKCELAGIYVGGLSDPDPEIRQRDSALYQRHRDEAIASALAIKDEFYQGFGIHQAINLCRSAHDFDMARTLFKKVDDDFLREQILKGAPELAAEEKKRLTEPTEERASPDESPSRSSGDYERWALEQFPIGATGGGECQAILRSWFPRLRKEAKQVDQGRDEYLDQYELEIGGAVDVLQKLQSAFSADERSPDPDQKRAARYTLWAWPSDAALQERPKDWYRESPTSIDYLDNPLADYLKRPWLQHDVIDASAINALLFTELAVFVEQLKIGTALGKPNWSYIFSGGNMFAQVGLHLGGKIIGFLVAWIMLPAIAVGLLVYGHQTGAATAISLWGLYVLYRLVMVPVRYSTRKARQKTAEKANEITQAMLKAWYASRGSVINPSRLRELVLAAEARGATFPSVLHTIIDRAINRDATALVRG